jgi:ankyrin repeat protein
MAQDFFSACESGNAERVRELLQGGVDIDVRNCVSVVKMDLIDSLLQVRRTPLHFACAGGHVGVVAILLEAGAKIGVKDQVSEI